jgi:hypothetical protein
MLSLYDSAMNYTIYLEKWYYGKVIFSVLHYVVYDINTVSSQQLAVNRDVEIYKRLTVS